MSYRLFLFCFLSVATAFHVEQCSDSAMFRLVDRYVKNEEGRVVQYGMACLIPNSMVRYGGGKRMEPGCWTLCTGTGR